MEIKVYADVLFLTNFIADYLLLAVVCALTKARRRRPRLFLAAAGGALYACFAFFWAAPFWLDAPVKLAAGAAMAWLAFGGRRLSRVLRYIAAFYAAAFCFAGLCFSLFRFTGVFSVWGGVMKDGGLYYINLPLWALFALGAGGYFGMEAVFSFLKAKRLKADVLCEIEIFHNGKSVRLKALRDTGNFLRAPLSGRGVALIEFRKLKPLLKETTYEKWLHAAKERLLPCVCRGQTIFTFIPEKVRLLGKNASEIEKICVGAWPETLDPFGDFDAILPNSVFMEEDNEEDQHEATKNRSGAEKPLGKI
jgi:stage II sporulation protein GA (sporulation sigma-E factor processing peptidase)